MPELPEIETIRRNLTPIMENMLLTELCLHRKNLRFDFPENFSSLVKNKKIIRVSRRAKYFIIELEGDMSIIVHLGMSGSFIVESKTTSTIINKNIIKDPRHNHVIISIENDDKTLKYRIIYNDPRRFGFMDLAKTSLIEKYPPFAKMGPEPIDINFNTEYLTNQFYKRKSSIKNALLNQQIVSGLGNIYVCEALWRAKLSPMQNVKSLAQENISTNFKLSKLIEEIRNVLFDAINAGGSSLRDYIHADGSIGRFQNSLAVYGRTGEACPANCGQFISRIVQSGRSTFYCSHCQQ
ncbi:bifunctional DNA-formamidopyrimidine glycosylase/DNA-(apurinic or apyrimidinic site) lyase [Candidatus Liberibacter americanus]|uniref:Formamidopyrimidine-DNA glycosylase n=1 Tax=Candidatus Liberibacter americanus str. Sao Paulo TaxID=1261131 RepID=U6B936_9HYPH|nr:bifunctional DNA-formamidopyrimidine glycosylase/DNA-(apurinic or apyrimidinic site) lyase [Candidatus Liberibacter americanus]AHA28371.1 Formamidopyrimidine-DNA glycosylase [Candidatus Liberibacter americanus str. Sao Paulo]EMS36660.1 formamidopyrimidine-DNA glycosylase [Candidatus Liberibacter americanus PW_SP]